MSYIYYTWVFLTKAPIDASLCHARFSHSTMYIKSLLGLSHKNKAWRGRSSSVLQIEMLIKQPRSRRQISETPVGAHLQIVARQIQDFQETLRQSVPLRELAATSYLQGRLNLIIALAMANLCQLSAEFQAF